MVCDAKQVESFAIDVDLKPPLCPVCDKEMDRVFRIQTIVFKGSGWGKD